MEKGVKFLLKEIIDEYGVYEIKRADRCAELLSLKYGGYSEDFLPISKALDYGILEDLLRVKLEHRSRDSLDLLVSRLIVRMNIQEYKARWIVSVWSFALGIIEDDGDVRLTEYRKKIVVGKGESVEYDSLYRAIEEIEPGGEIEVMPGIYYGHYRIKKPLTITGSSKESVILESDMLPVFSILETGKCIIKNLTIRGVGNTERDKTNLVVVSRSSVHILDCDIRSASLSGILGYGKGADLYLKDSSISMCNQSGIVVSDDARCTLEGVSLYSNSGAQILARDNANLFVFNSQISNGNNAGIRVDSESNLFCDVSEIANNKRAGIIISYNSCATIKNSRINNNRASGITVSNMSCTTIEDCQIYQNGISGIRFDKNSDFFNYASNVKDGVVTINTSKDDIEDDLKSEAIDEFVKNPPPTDVPHPPDTLESAVIEISFILIFEVIGMIMIEVLGVLFGIRIGLGYMLLIMGIVGAITGFGYIIRKY